MEMSHQLVLKTNLLYDAALMPSLEVEYLINDRWSVNLEGEMAWWKNNHKHKYYQLATISPEGRYWFKAKRPWHGHYVGLFGGFSWYDLENGKDGYKGEAVMAGLSYGYMFPVCLVRRVSADRRALCLPAEQPDELFWPTKAKVFPSVAAVER